MIAFTKLAALPAALLIVVLGAACGGGEKDNPDVIVIGDRNITPVIATSELVVGVNRFVVGVLDRESYPIVDAKVRFTFFDLNSGSPVKVAEMDAVSRIPAKDAGLSEEVVHVHADGSRHTHINAGDEIGVYTAMVNFDKAGDWGVEVAVDSSKPKVKEAIGLRFNVIPQSVTPAIGSSAPLTKNLTLADVDDITRIDSSSSPAPELHRETIAGAIEAGKPSLVLFAVPGFCDSRLCGPEYEIMKKLYPKYEGKAAFIHVEFYKEPGSPQRVISDAAKEWNLRTKPWFFVIDGRGIITAKFEGPTTLSELDEALQEALQKSAAGP